MLSQEFVCVGHSPGSYHRTPINSPTMLPGILITWSDEDIDEGIQASLIQTNAVLLSTLFSINRDQLSIFDAKFALLLSSSPLTVYLVIVVYCWLCGMKTGLDNHISPRPLIVLLGAWTPFFWLVLSMVLRLSGEAFINSRLCVDSTFGSWLHDVANFLLVAIQIGSYFLFFVPFFSICLTLIIWRRWSQITSGVWPPGNLGLRGWFRMPWRFVKHVWCVLADSCRCGTQTVCCTDRFKNNSPNYCNYCPIFAVYSPLFSKSNSRPYLRFSASIIHPFRCEY